MRQTLTALIKKEHRQSSQNVKAIRGQFQHALVAADIDKKERSEKDMYWDKKDKLDER